jgi:8-oxo-dGDP phosphatase
VASWTDVEESWPVLDSEDLHRDDWVMALRRDTVTTPEGGEPFRRLVLEHPGSAVVLAVDEEERVLCLRQYRHPVGRRLLELPAGLIDHPGEDPLDVARRELREEAAYSAERWEPLLTAYSSPGVSSELIHYYLARGLKPIDRGDFVLEHEEAHLETHWVPVDEIVTAGLAGDLADAPLLLAVMAYVARG